MDNFFDSEYCKVEYVDKENVILLKWKKFASLENYRQPTTFALKLLQKYSNSNFVIDARNGFEDIQEDVEWGFSYLIPEMSKTDCKKVAFIMNQVNEIEDEMDMWSKEFGKFFAVFKAATFEEAYFKMNHMLWVDVKYVIKSEKRSEFYSKLVEKNIIEASRQEAGNYRYDVSTPMENENELWLTEIWIDEFSQKRHGKTEHYEMLTLLKKEYVEHVDINRYCISK